MISTIFLILLSANLCIAEYPDLIRKMSPDATLDLYDSLSTITSDNFLKMTELEYSTENLLRVQSDLREMINQHINNQSWFMKMAGLFSFENVLLVMAVFVGMFLIISVVHDGFFRLLANKYVHYVLGFGFGIINTYDHYENLLNTPLGPWLLFSYQTPLFGCVLFGLTCYYFYGREIMSKEMVNMFPCDLIVLGFLDNIIL